MSYPGHEMSFPTRTPAEEKLYDWTAVFNCQNRPDAYFDKSLSLLCTIKSQHAEVVEKLTLYLQHAKGELLCREISQEIERRKGLICAAEKNAEKAEKKNARTKR